MGGEIMGMGDELGLVKEGYLADLLLVAATLRGCQALPDRDNLLMIMKDGAYHKPPQPRRHEPGAGRGRIAGGADRTEKCDARRRTRASAPLGNRPSAEARPLSPGPWWYRAVRRDEGERHRLHLAVHWGSKYGIEEFPEVKYLCSHRSSRNYHNRIIQSRSSP